MSLSCMDNSLKLYGRDLSRLPYSNLSCMAMINRDCLSPAVFVVQQWLLRTLDLSLGAALAPRSSYQ